MLTSRERLDRCFKHMETDRPGLYIRGVDLENPIHESYTPLRELVTKECDLKATFWTVPYKDRSKVSCKTENYNEHFERHITIIHTPSGDLRRTWMADLKGNYGYIEKYFIETLEEAEMYLDLPEEELVFDPNVFFEMDRRLGDRGITVADMGLNPAGSVVELLGSESFAVWSIEYRDILHKLMEREMNVLLKNVKLLLDKKIGPYFGMLGEEYITPPLHGPKDFKDFNVKYDRPILDMIHNAGGLVHIHSHGPLKGLLEYFLEIGADVLHPIEAPPMGNVTIKVAKDILRGRVCIEGNIQIGDMYESTTEEIRDMVEVVIREAFDDSRGLIVCPTASPYIPVLSCHGLENYRRLIDTVLKHRY